MILVPSFTLHLCRALLSVGGTLAIGVCVVGRRWLVGLAGLLGLQSYTTLLVRLNRDSLVVDKTSVLLGVLVGHVERIARELHTAGSLGLDEESIVVFCGLVLVLWHNFEAHSEETRTDDLPEEIGGDVGRHGWVLLVVDEVVYAAANFLEHAVLGFDDCGLRSAPGVTLLRSRAQH
jgi:hypothetical protein